MCVSVTGLDDFERALVRKRLTRTMLDNWLKDQLEDVAYQNTFQFFQKFGVYIGLDRQVSVSSIEEADPRFLNIVTSVVALPRYHIFGAARERLINPKSDIAKSRLDLIAA